EIGGALDEAEVGTDRAVAVLGVEQQLEARSLEQLVDLGVDLVVEDVVGGLEIREQVGQLESRERRDQSRECSRGPGPAGDATLAAAARGRVFVSERT